MKKDQIRGYLHRSVTEVSEDFHVGRLNGLQDTLIIPQTTKKCRGKERDTNLSNLRRMEVQIKI